VSRLYPHPMTDETPQERYDRIRSTPSRKQILEDKFGWLGWLLAVAFLLLIVWDYGLGYFLHI
jgi:hypothetical protein